MKIKLGLLFVCQKALCKKNKKTKTKNLFIYSEYRTS